VVPIPPAGRPREYWRSTALSRYARPLAAALAVVPGPGDTVTFVHQTNGPYAGNWLLPGGGIELGETAETAARREVAEETGCHVPRLDLFAVYEFLGEWTDGPYHLVMFAFLAAEPAVVPPGFAGDGVRDVRQVRVGRLPLHSTDLRILTDAGVASFGPDEIERALAADGITMRAHVVGRTWPTVPGVVAGERDAGR
jgi:8-oxo-dGTP diphosphatase